MSSQFATMQIQMTLLKSAIRSKLLSSRRKIKKVASSSRRSVLSTSVHGERLKARKSAMKLSSVQLLKLLRADLSSISDFVASCQHHSSKCVASAISHHILASRLKLALSNSTRIAITLFFHVAHSLSRHSQNHVQLSLTSYKRVKFVQALSHLSLTLVHSLTLVA
ncbi:unannotated protein [freshwater metagenome]|uniref:Unannotated protein n=1 Tax=freshwater metagenome TaxID=449393 RepID=A0A6J7EUM3_9ZZZZ